jgi:hypothetical protein
VCARKNIVGELVALEVDARLLLLAYNNIKKGRAHVQLTSNFLALTFLESGGVNMIICAT